MLGSYGSSQTGDSGLTISRSVSLCNFLLSPCLLNLFVRYYILIMRREDSKVKQIEHRSWLVVTDKSNIEYFHGHSHVTNQSVPVKTGGKLADTSNIPHSITFLKWSRRNTLLLHTRGPVCDPCGGQNSDPGFRLSISGDPSKSQPKHHHS